MDLLDADGKTEGVRVATTGDKLLVNLDHTKTQITVHADGKVLIEGTQGVTIDLGRVGDGAQGASISLKATGGVTVDGGGGAGLGQVGQPAHPGRRRDGPPQSRHGQDQLRREAA